MAKKKPGAGAGDATNPWPARLRTLREKQGLTQAQAAEKAGVALRTWINWEAGHQQPSGPSAALLRITFPTDL